MGLFKGMKDMKAMVSAAPGLMDQANQLSANAQAMQAQAVYAQTMQAQHPAGVSLSAELDEPIAGVDLRTFAEVCAGLADHGYDQSKAVEVAAARGIDAGDWQLAMDGWNDRIAQHPAVASRFNAIYTGRA